MKGSHQTIVFPLRRMTYLYWLDVQVPMELRYTFCRTHANNSPGFLVFRFERYGAMFSLCLGSRASQRMGFLCATLINFSVGIFVDKMEKQSCRMPTILEGNIAIDSQGMRNYLGFFSNFRPGKFRIPDLFKFGRSNKLWSK